MKRSILFSALIALFSSCSTTEQPADLQPISLGAEFEGVYASDDTPLPDGVDEAWLDEVGRRIAADQRRFTEISPGLIRARVGRTQMEFGADGLLARHEHTVLQLRFSAWGRESQVELVEPAEPRIGGCVPDQQKRADGSCLRQIELAHESLTEWWRCQPRGLQQGWLVHQPPPGDDLLVFEIQLEEAILLELDGDGNGAELLGDYGGLWRYDGLAAWDALGDPVPAWMAAAEGGLRLWVDDSAAIYPLTVDPVLTPEATKLTASDGVGGGGYFGYSVSNAGDVNNDGYDDIVVGAYQDDDNGAYSGSAYVYHGSVNGIDAASETKLTAADAAASDLFGYSVSGAGDVNNDG